MKVILGSKEWVEKVDDKETRKSEVLTCEIPDKPAKLSDFPKAAILASPPSGRQPGKVCVVTVDGKRFYVDPDRKQAAQPQQ